MNRPPKRGPEFSREREWGVILEDLQSQFRTFGEGLQDVRNRLEGVEERLGRVEIKVNVIESKVNVMESAFPRFFVQLSDHETRLTNLEKTSH